MTTQPTYTICEYRCRYGWPYPTRWYVIRDDGFLICWTYSLRSALTVTRFLRIAQ